MAKKSAPPKSAKSSPASPAEKNPAYVVFARRFRPNSFAEVVGQTAVTTALRQGLNSGRVAQAYLFCGPRGVGKTSLARIFAKAINCLNGKAPGGVAEEPCNTCEACVAIQEGRALDVIEMDAATNRGIEEIRSLRENVGLAPAELRAKVYIIDEVHMLTKEAWNAFLKTLEEPPAHVKFVFATTDPNNVPETILSRCQRYDLRRIGPADIVKRLKQICTQEKIDCEEMALSRIAGLARGGLRDAEGLLDQAVNLSQGKVTDAVVRELAGAAPDELMLEILKACALGQTTDVLAKTHQALEAGADPEDMLNALVERLRGTLLAKVCGGDSPLLEGQTHLKAAYAELGALLTEDQLLLLVQIFTSARRQMRDAAQTRLPLEMALIRAARARELVDLGKLVTALEAGAPTRPPPTGEGHRPNLSGRPAGLVESRPAADTPKAGTAGGSSRPAPESGDLRSRLTVAAKAQKGGALLASAITFAAVVKEDAAAGTLTLGFAPEQLFYTDTLEKPEALKTLQAIVSAVLGRSLKVQIQRLAAGEAPRVQVPPRMAVAAPAPADEDGAGGGEETEVEFDGVDELPLPRSVPEAAAEARPVGPDGEDDEPLSARTPALLPKKAAAFDTAPAARPSEAEVQEIGKHPFLQALVKETGGVIMNVRRGGVKTAAAKSTQGQKDARRS